VKAYNSNGLWLQAPEVVAAEAIALRDEGDFTALKLRLGRDRASDDLAAIHAIRAAVGDDMELIVKSLPTLTPPQRSPSALISLRKFGIHEVMFRVQP
jgi:L-alanine-DL-glutamate epimerase-like enolase superfamily enzyme